MNDSTTGLELFQCPRDAASRPDRDDVGSTYTPQM